jgi:hypothetical protein
MRLVVSSLCLLVVAGKIGAQSSQGHQLQAAAVERAKSVLVSSLDRSLPKVSLEFFLKYEAEGSPVEWSVGDCGKNDVTPNDPHDMSACVEADFDVNNQAVSVVVSMGTSKAGARGPALFSAAITDFAGTVHPLGHLAQLPMMLHRPLRRLPRDNPDPGTSIGEVGLEPGRARGPLVPQNLSQQSTGFSRRGRLLSPASRVAHGNDEPQALKRGS